MNYLIRDRDRKYCREFDESFEKADVSVEPTAPRAPNQNAYIERWIGSLRKECLGRFILFGKRHLYNIVSEYVSFCNELRPHQSLENRPLQGCWPKLDEPPTDNLKIVSHHLLGSVLKHYERIAAYAISSSSMFAAVRSMKSHLFDQQSGNKAAQLMTILRQINRSKTKFRLR